jgi:hypothetical protein
VCSRDDFDAIHWQAKYGAVGAALTESTVWQGMPVDVFWSLCCDISELPPALFIEQVL